MKKHYIAVSLLLAASMGLSACGGNTNSSNNGETSNGSAAGNSGEQVKIEFFQNKGEAVAIYDEIIQEFETQHPNIDVEQNNRPESGVYLQSRLSTNDVPDLMAINPLDFRMMADSGMVVDFTDNEVLGNLQPVYIDFLKKFSEDGKVGGVPYTANAQTVLYNKDMFEEMGLQVPTTWDELIQVSEDIKQKGGTPFFFGYKDSWTTLVGFNSLIGNTAGELFGDTVAADISFKDNVQEAAEKEYQLMQYANKDPFGQNYDQASSAFAKGESAMYLQGIWAIAPIKNANPDINLGSFALPVKDAAEENLLVSGVDQLFAVSKDSKNQEEVIEFIRFLLEPEQAERFINDQGLLSAVQGVNNSNPILDGIKPYLDGGKLVNTPDAFFPQSFDVKPYLQSYLLDGDLNKFLDDSDKAWKQSAAQ